MFYRLRTDASYMPPGDTPAPMYSLIFYRLKFAHVDDFALSVK
jgi:hypothetical protein